MPKVSSHFGNRFFFQWPKHKSHVSGEGELRCWFRKTLLSKSTPFPLSQNLLPMPLQYMYLIQKKKIRLNVPDNVGKLLFIISAQDSSKIHNKNVRYPLHDLCETFEADFFYQADSKQRLFFALSEVCKKKSCLKLTTLYFKQAAKQSKTGFGNICMLVHANQQRLDRE